MSLKQFDTELRSAIIGGLEDLFTYIHNNPNAPAGQAQTAVRNYVAANTDYAEAWADKLATRVLSLYDGTWVTFRNNTLGYRLVLKSRWAEVVFRELS